MIRFVMYVNGCDIPLNIPIDDMASLIETFKYLEWKYNKRKKSLYGQKSIYIIIKGEERR